MKFRLLAEYEVVSGNEMKQPSGKAVRVVKLCLFEQIHNVQVHGGQLSAGHALQLCDDEEFTDVLQSGDLVHLSADQETHGLENASWATRVCV